MRNDNIKLSLYILDNIYRKVYSTEHKTLVGIHKLRKGAMYMTVNMFDIFYADLSKNTVKSEQGGVRPVIVIQNDMGNKYSPTVIVIPITSELKKINMPTHCVLHKTSKNGLSVNSMVLAEQIRVIDKSRLLKQIGYLDSTKEQNDVINAYIANITGKKSYNSVWTKIINLIFKLVREGEYNDAA